MQNQSAFGRPNIWVSLFCLLITMIAMLDWLCSVLWHTCDHFVFVH